MPSYDYVDQYQYRSGYINDIAARASMTGIYICLYLQMENVATRRVLDTYRSLIPAQSSAATSVAFSQQG